MKKLSVIAACILIVCLLGGCGNKFDAAAYTKAILDNSYKNDSTDFVSIKVGTAEKASEIYKQGLDAEVNAILAIIGADVTDKQALEFRPLVADILAGVKYTVGEAQKQDDNSYVVTITCEQMQIYGPAMRTYKAETEELVYTWTEAAAAGEETPSEDEIIDAYVTSIKNSFENAFQNVTYAEPETIAIRIELIDNEYTPNRSDIVYLETRLFDLNAVSDVFQ